MTRKLFVVLASGAVLATPMAAVAQDSATVTVLGTVQKTCVVGTPTAMTMDLGVLTGTDGRILPALAGNAPSATAEIQNAWCNTPSVLSLNADPMALIPTPAYSTPAGFARLITYDATLSGWPSDLLDRPTVNSPAVTAPADGPHASPLTLEIASLVALDAAGAAENSLAVIEAGGYAGSIVVSVAVQ